MKSIKELFYKYEEIISYLIVGGLTTMVSLITYYLLVYTILDPNIGIELQIANIVSWIFSVTFAYFTNRKYVFKSKNKISFKEGISFYISRIGSLQHHHEYVAILVEHVTFYACNLSNLVHIVE